MKNLALLLAGLCCLGTCATGGENKQRVPANFSQINDSSGLRWDIQQNGSINDGDSDCFDGGLVLQVNGREFNADGQPTMSPDRTEYFLENTRMVPGVKIERRIRIDQPRNYVQYFEVFTNTGNKETKVACMIRSNFGNNPQMIVDDAGQAVNGGPLGKKNIGVLAVQSPGDQRPSVLMVLADEKSKVKPMLQRNGNSLMVIYELSLKPKETAAVMHLVGQRRAAQVNSAPSLFEDLYKRHRLVKIPLPKELAKVIANFPPVSNESDTILEERSAFRSILAQLEPYGLEREKKDWLIFDGESNLSGEISIPQYKVKTVFGEVEVPPAQIAYIRGGGGLGRPVRTALRSGEILAGAVSAPGMKMTGDKGMVIDLDPANLQAVVMRAGKEDGYSEPGTAVIVRLHTGDAVALAQDQQVPLEGATPWGSLKIDLTKLEALSLTRTPHPICQIAFADHSLLPVILYGDTVKAKSLRFGEIEISPLTVTGLYPGLGKEQKKPEQEKDAPDYEFELDPYAPCFRLGESAIAAGTFGEKTLTLITEGGPTVVPVEQIRRLLPAEDEKGQRYTLTFLGGGSVTGSLSGRMISIVTPEGTLQVPVQHLREYCGKKPAGKPEATGGEDKGSEEPASKPDKQKKKTGAENQPAQPAAATPAPPSIPSAPGAP